MSMMDSLFLRQIFAVIVQYVVECCNGTGSNIYLASFDSENHFQLYQILLKRHVPNAFLDIFINWYSTLTVTVTWNRMEWNTFIVAVAAAV